MSESDTTGEIASEAAPHAPPLDVTIDDRWAKAIAAEWLRTAPVESLEVELIARRWIRQNPTAALAEVSVEFTTREGARTEAVTHDGDKSLFEKPAFGSTF